MRSHTGFRLLTLGLCVAGCQPDWAGQLEEAERRALASIPADAVLWLSADVEVELEDDGSVRRWRDRSIHARHAVANGVTPAPRVQMRDARAYLAFSGEAELRLPLVTGVSALSFFAVAKPAEHGRMCPAILHLSHSADMIIQEDDLEFGRHEGVFHYESRSDFVPSREVTEDAFDIAAPHLLTVQHGPDELASLRIDGVLAHEGNMPLPSGRDRAWNFIGSNHYYSQGKPHCQSFAGDIGEIVLYARRVSDAERDEIEAYLSKKWAISRTGD